MKSGKIEVRDYWYLAIGLIVFAFVVIGKSVYVTYKNSYYDSDLYRAIADKEDIKKVEILSNWPIDELSAINQAEGYYSWGISLYNLGQLDESESHLNKVLALSPSSIGEYFIESSAYDYLHGEACLLLAEIALEKKDFARVEWLIDRELNDYKYSGCGTMALMKYSRIESLKTEVALATRNEYQTLDLLGQNLFFPNQRDSVRIRQLVDLIKVKYLDEVIRNELNDLLRNLQEVRIVNDNLGEFELYEYNCELFGVQLTVCDEHGFPYELQKEFEKFCKHDLISGEFSDCTTRFLKKQIKNSYFYQELMK